MMDDCSIWTVLEKYNKKAKGKESTELPTYQQLMEEEPKKRDDFHKKQNKDKMFNGDLKEMAIVTIPSPYLMLPNIDRYQILTIDKQGKCDLNMCKHH